MFSSSFWPGLCAFAGVTLAMLVLIDFGIYIAARYRERYLKEATTELDDVLIQMPANRVLDVSVALSVFGAVIVIVLAALHSDVLSWKIMVLLALAAGIILFPVPRLLLKMLRKRRIDKFNVQLEDALGMMSGALKAGFSIHQALESVVDMNIHPISIEFRLLLQETRLGVPLDQALENMNRRLGSDDFELVTTSIITARMTGGELTGNLERVAELVRERVRIKLKVRALTAMGRLQAILIGAMPFLLLFGLNYVSPQMMYGFLHSPAGIAAIAVVIVLDICGFLCIKKITTIEV